MSRGFDVDRIIWLVISLLVRFEGVILHPYLCPGGYPTIGLGSRWYADGTAVTLRDPPITREHALMLARWNIRRDYLPTVLRICQTLDSEERIAAIVDFAYNLGTGALRSSTLRRVILARNWAAVPYQLRRWVRAAGRVMRGLELRREAEITMFQGEPR